MSYARFLLIGLVLCLPVYLLGCPEDSPPRAFDQQVWKTASDRVRGQMAQDLIDKKILIGKTRMQVINLLGRPYEEDKQFVTYLIYFGNEFAPPPFVYIEFDSRQIVKNVLITD